MRKSVSVFLAPFLAALLVATPILAGDGVVEINTAAVNAGGITPSDDPGFPATIDRRGSYRLTGNLNPPTGRDGVEILAEDVTLDLNGFTIRGPSIIICPIGGCPPNDGIGVRGTNRNRVHDGLIRNMGGHGVGLGSHSTVERVTSTDNGGAGITLSRSSRVHGCVASENAGIGIRTGFYSVLTDNTSSDNDEEGIRAEASSVVRGNVARGNGETGIFASGGMIEGNLSTGNGGFGIRAINNATVIGNSVTFNDQAGITMTGSGYANNVAASNGDFFSSSDEIVGGVSTGGNVCDTAPCP